MSDSRLISELLTLVFLLSVFYGVLIYSSVILMIKLGWLPFDSLWPFKNLRKWRE